MIRDNSFKLKEVRFKLEMKNNFFLIVVVRHRNKLPEEVVDAPSLAVFKVRLDSTLSHLV